MTASLLAEALRLDVGVEGERRGLFGLEALGRGAEEFASQIVNATWLILTPIRPWEAEPR